VTARSLLWQLAELWPRGKTAVLWTDVHAVSRHFRPGTRTQILPAPGRNKSRYLALYVGALRSNIHRELFKSVRILGSSGIWHFFRIFKFNFEVLQSGLQNASTQACADLFANICTHIHTQPSLPPHTQTDSVSQPAIVRMWRAVRSSMFFFTTYYNDWSLYWLPMRLI
jgi:hypothetical protein